MPANILPLIRARFDATNGQPLTGGKVFTYRAGTSTPLATYTSVDGDVQNTNPVILSSSGEADIYLATGKRYKIVVKDRHDNLLYTVDKVLGASPSGGGDGWIDVKNYGATGDGVTDDTAAFQAAINAAASSAMSIPLGQGVNKTLYVPAGQYKITASLTVPGRMNMIGDGARSSVLKFTSTTGAMLRATADISYSTWEKMQWVGPGNGTGNAAMGFQADTTVGAGKANIFINFKEMIVEKFPQCAFYVSDSFACTWEDMDVRDCGTVGTIAGGNAAAAADSYGGGIRLAKINFVSGASTGNKYINSYIRRCGRGIYIDGNERLTNTGFWNVFFEENYIGADINGRGASQPSKETTLYTTYFEANLYAGMLVGQGTAIQCYRNNTIAGTGLAGSCSTSGPDGIVFSEEYTEIFDGRFSVGNKASAPTVGTKAAFRVDKTDTINNIAEANFADQAIKFGEAAERDVGIYAGQGSPNGNVTADSGSLYVRRNSSAADNGRAWIKTSDASNTGWQPINNTVVTTATRPTADASNKGLQVYDTDILRVVTSNGAGVWREYNGLTTVRDTLANTPSHYEGARFYATDIDALLVSDGSAWMCAYKKPVFVSASSGGTTTVSARGGLVVNSGGAIASHTVTMPSGTSAVSGDRVVFSTAGAITTLTVNAGAATVSGAPTTLAANSSFEFVYNSSATTWYRVR